MTDVPMTAPALGPCCICGGLADVRNIMMLDRLSPIPGRGWGCMVCGLPADGATAVLCDACRDDHTARDVPLKFVCRGYPAEDGRAPFEDLDAEVFAHDAEKHRLDELAFTAGVHRQ